MPYERVDPAAWWHGAEAAPPMPEVEGPWELAPTPYGYAWRRPEPTVSTHRGPMTLDRLRAGLEALHASDPSSAPEVRVGDRVRCGHDPSRRVEFMISGYAGLEGIDGGTIPYLVSLSDIGPPGSGKPWTLLPPVPMLDVHDPDTARIIREELRSLGLIGAGAQQLHAGGGGGIGP